MKFTKMHGCGNDYIYVNCFEETIEDRNETARIISDRHFGVGSDGLICIDPSEVADFRMDMYNADGSQGKMCGNGIRCVGKYVYDYGMTDKTTVTIETLGGIKTLHLDVQDGQVKTVRVCMGAPGLRPKEIPVLMEGDRIVQQPIEVLGNTWEVTCVSMGSAHAVTFIDDADGMDLREIGPAFENHALFPERVNAEFVQVVDAHHIKMRVWERGSGETLACGTGASASVVACILSGKTDHQVTVHTRGGDLEIEWDQTNNLIYMTGPAAIVFEGNIRI